MRFASKSVTALAFTFALAACGGGSDQAETPDTAATATEAAATPTDTATPAATDTATPAATPTATATPSPTPTATPTKAAAATAAPTTAAVAQPPAFAVCKACHSVEPGKNGIGPSLAGIWGEKAGAVPGFDFSDAMKASNLTWNQATLDKYLTDPKGTVPGTKMSFGGVKDAAKRQAIIDYIKGL
jgi:cytochrome c2